MDLFPDRSKRANLRCVLEPLEPLLCDLRLHLLQAQEQQHKQECLGLFRTNSEDQHPSLAMQDHCRVLKLPCSRHGLLRAGLKGQRLRFCRVLKGHPMDWFQCVLLPLVLLSSGQRSQHLICQVWHLLCIPLDKPRCACRRRPSLKCAR